MFCCGVVIVAVTAHVGGDGEVIFVFVFSLDVNELQNKM